MSIEAVLLTGGASRRMGSDKASLEIDGETLALRTARELAAVASRVTVLGRKPIADYEFLADAETYAGPRAALRRYVPEAEFVFVASCDLPRFDRRVVAGFREAIGNAEACVPVLADRRQPTCALYTRSALERLRRSPPEEVRLMAWLETLNVRELNEAALRAAEIDPAWVGGVNTRDEWARFLEGRP